MDKNHCLRITFAAHRVADALPLEVEMRYRIKDSATEVLADFFLINEEAILAERKKDIEERMLKEIQSLKYYLEAARQGRWIDETNFVILEKEYDGMVSIVRSTQIAVSRPSHGRLDPPAGGSSEISLSDRQRRILEMLRNKERTQVWELQKVLPEVTKRTLRRDLDDLLKMDLVERQGEWNEVFYRIKNAA